jgi:glycosyltransferase involved in cell wall biosynthesis
MSRRRVLMVKFTLQPPGGGQAVAAWMLEALKGRYELGVLTWTPLDLDAVNRFYGTSLNPSDLSCSDVGAAVRLLDKVPPRLSLMRQALLMRVAQRIAPGYDVVMTVDYEADFGQPGIQYINIPIYRRPRPRDDVRWYHGPGFVLDAYYALADLIAPMTKQGIRSNVTLANSDWIRGLVRDRHGIEAATLYPPIAARFRDVPWSERKNAFVCIGRVSPEKQIPRIVEILKRVRQRVPSVSLCIVGTFDRTRYAREVRRLLRAESEWISVEEWLSRDELVALIPTFRYGIHGMLEEHFGMAPAEMVTAGCIVFLHRGGGQVEIVGGDSRLTYETVDDAVERIATVLESPDEQADLRRALSARASLFSADHFMAEIRSLVDRFPNPVRPSLREPSGRAR